jgi:hypothetical protein
MVDDTLPAPGRLFAVCFREWIGWIHDHRDKDEGLLRSFATAPPQTEIQESRTKPLTEFIIFSIDRRCVMDNIKFSYSVVRFKICYRHREKANRSWLKFRTSKFQKRIRAQSCARERAGEIIQKTHGLACSVNSVEIALKWTRWQMK